MRGRALPFLFALLLSAPAYAQVTWQPTPPPLVTADNEGWFRTGAAIEWNGDFYYSAGTAEAFNAYQMVRAGSYRGIPLYTDTTLEPYSIVFVPIAGGRMQPYERPRTGMLAGSVGSRASLLPAGTAGAMTITPEGYVAQAPAPPTFARGYDLAPAAAVPQPVSPAVPIVGTTGAVAASAPAPRPAATSGRLPRNANLTATAYFDYDGRRWVSAGKAMELDASFARVGDFRGAPVYQHHGDSLTIFIPTASGLVAPFKPKGL
jgi:hypothetical protein